MGTLSMWSEGIILSLVFLSVLGLAIAGMNLMYSKNYSVGLSDSSTEQLFITYQDSAQTNLRGGEVTFDASQGISLKSGWDLVIDATNVIWNFLTGGFLEKLIEMFSLGAPGVLLARALRIIWFLSLVFGLIYLIWKVKA